MLFLLLGSIYGLGSVPFIRPRKAVPEAQAPLPSEILLHSSSNESRNALHVDPTDIQSMVQRY